MKDNLINILGSVFLVIIVFGVGFYFGYKNSEAKNIGLTASKEDINSIAESITSKEDTSKIESKAINPEGVYWIKAGSDPNCPPEYPIKGKFDSSVNVFYTKENQFYNRVKAQICFASEEFASDKAGFIKKY